MIMRLMRPFWIIVVGLFACAVYAGMHRQSAVRSAVVAEHGLTGNAAAGYDQCQTVMSRKKLSNGGSMEEFCACFVQRTDDERRDGGESNAITYLRTMIESGGRPSPLPGSAGDSSHRELKYVSAFSSCIEDQRHSFANQADNARWCATHQVSEPDKRCSFSH
jgi:hypothetical protein